ncbi:hypothetical protein [Hymenobacter negativus]|uniref:STAS/SEC14 domain-containing protein n=1 Tax=Hymenobacter negativus TaxID=2795026 RepID=A0ABS0Q9C7_9BACT|nr:MULTISPECIES: hypothetical protein [Bacteria]MBH8558948.1 hypothetical protein [Hymenobacter negativus]MBH8567388.1 hypothetical protein [Hymenobacter negativus]MBR7207120.1 hypothetical protein [Microvirga sp. STS02]
MNPGNLRVHFRNAAGQLLEQPAGKYIIIEYTSGPRKFADLQTLLGHAKQLLALRGWHKVIGDHRLMTPFTPEESTWVNECWLSMPRTRMHDFYGAVLLPAEVLARLPIDEATGETTARALTYRLFAEEAEAAAWLAQLA